MAPPGGDFATASPAPSPEEGAEFEHLLISLHLLGDSAAFRDAMRLLKRVAPTDATVLLQGETGTGKELAARAVHYTSRRRTQPFIAVNCGAIPDGLIESELFGHERGAFTDAHQPHEGMIARASGGTLFLDELEALSPRGQVTLLRFLQDQEYRPLGGSARRGDVRIVGACNENLSRLAEEGRFRMDLVYRLDVLSIEMPPLRARGVDVLQLAQSFITRLCERYRTPSRTLAPACHDRLQRHSWPGNVRELENLVLREFLISDGPELWIDPPGRADRAKGRIRSEGVLTMQSFNEAKEQAVVAFERAYLTEVLDRAGGNVSLAARLAGKERSRLGKMIRKHGLSSPGRRAATND